MALQIEAFFDNDSNTFSYVVTDSASGDCAVIDPVLDFDYAAGRTATDSAEQIVRWIEQHGLRLCWILETHVHADHLSAARFLQQRCGGKIGIGNQITQVQQVFGEAFNSQSSFLRDGSQFDQLFGDGDALTLGELEISVLHTPGHTPACVSYQVGDTVFVGDTLFMPDYGTARCDFPGGDAAQLYASVQRLLALPETTRLFMCHDYKAPGRDSFSYETTVGAQKAANVHIRSGVTQAEFVQMRQARDATLAVPRLLLPSVQINMCAGQMPEPEANGRVYLKVPLNLF